MLDAALNHLLVTNVGNGTLGEYDATTGATINAMFVTGLINIGGLALDGSDYLFEANFTINKVGEYNAATGATIDASFTNCQGLSGPAGMLLVTPVPEPSTVALAGIAAAVFVIRRARGYSQHLRSDQLASHGP